MSIALLMILLVAAVAGLLHLALFLIHRRKANIKRQAQMETVSLRGPGQSVLIRLDRINGLIHSSYRVVCIVPLAMLAAHLCVSYVGQIPESFLRTLATAGLVIAYGAYHLVGLMRLNAKRRQYQCAYDGEVEVARELNRLMDEGYHVYHDFPADDFYIDHIVIGPTGVMAVETRTRSKASSRNRVSDPVVTYDGRMLHFPRFSDYQIIEKANYQAAWLSGWISSSLGEDIAARAIVALPGWSVKRTSADGIPVVNPSQIETLFRHIKPRPLSDRQLDSIVSHIDRQCRNTGIDGNCCYTAAS